MGLLDALQRGDPVANRGLLDFGLALLSSRGNFANAVGMSGLAGLQGADRYKAQLAAFERAKINDEILQAQLKAMQDAQRQQQTMQEMAGKYYRTPQQQALAQGGGPTVANAQAAQTMPGGFDQQGFIGELISKYPLVGLEMQQRFAKQAPQPIKLGEGDQLLDPTTYKPIATNPKAPKDQEDAFVRRMRAAGIDPASPQGQQLLMQLLRKEVTHSPGVSVSYGAPMAGVDQQGNPVFFQPSKGGGAPAIIPGVAPPPNPTAVKNEAEAKQARQTAADKARQAYDTIDKMLTHPGLDTTLGLSGQLDPRNRIWGTEAQGAKALVEQAQGQAFLQAFESLKGGGQITQIEGEKATAAMARLQRAQKPSDFKAAAKELQDIAEKAYERATGAKMEKKPAKVLRFDAQGNPIP